LSVKKLNKNYKLDHLTRI